MKLDPSVYAEFERVVGPENISGSDAITQTYAYNWGNELTNIQMGKGFSPFAEVPAAVILPSTVGEVQEIVRLCNRYGIKFKAQSTGFGPWNSVSVPRAVVMDLRRMNHIVKIDSKNLYAVIEPYVTGAQLQSELMKHGLNCHMPGAGPQVSPLAAGTSMAGPGFTSISTGYAGRNVLGVEWVLPSGDLVRLGSLSLKDSEKADWFTGDGPGPSLRGIMRGFMGALGGLGVFTKAAVKLYPFPCEPTWKIRGNSPNYELTVPDFMQFHVADFKTYEALETGMRRVAEEEIAFICFHTSTYGIGAVFRYSNWGFIKAIPQTIGVKHPMVVVIAARTRREFEYKERVLKAVLKETKGKDLTANGRFVPKSVSYAEALRNLLGFHGFLIGVAFQSTHGGMDTMTMCRNMIQANIPLKKTFIKQKVIGPDKGEGVWSAAYENGHFYHAEMPTMYDQTDERSCQGMNGYMHKCDQLDLANHYCPPFFVVGDEMHDWYGPSCSNYQIWLRKIKEALDPENISDPGFYISSRRGEGDRKGVGGDTKGEDDKNKRGGNY